jgi:hypothetical protein
LEILIYISTRAYIIESLCRQFLFEMANTLNCAKVFAGAVVPNHKETASILMLWVYIHDDVFNVFNFFCALIVELQKLQELYKI